MPNFNIIKKVSYKNTYRNEAVKGQFDLNIEEVKENFVGEIPIENLDWNIGIIYGASGTGKTTIAKQLFDKDYIIDYEWDNNKSILDNMPKNVSINEITKTFNSVGFATVWSWLKPYNVLSQGEQMRVNLARALLEDKDITVFDEFTSVVNREVAKHSSYAISKAIRRSGKKFIAVSCHYDIIEWLESDWVFNTDKMEFKNTRGLVRRPDIKLDIYECERKLWQVFKKYHYLSSNLNSSSKCYVGTINDIPVVFCAIVHFPHPKVKNIKRIHRIVVLPDYQGLGIAIKLCNFLGDLYKKNSYRLRIVFTTKALISSFANSDLWILEKPFRKHKHNNLNANSSSKYTYACEYIG